MKGGLKNLHRVFGEVFIHTSYIALASVFAIAAFFVSVWLPNFWLISEVFGTESAPLATKLKITLALLGGISTNFSFLSAGYTIAIAVLFGMNVAMVVYFLKRTCTGLGGQNLTAGVSGIASGALGIGCAACGSFLLTSILPLFGASWLLSYLPFTGREFGILAVILLLTSLYLTAKKIQNPAVCRINPQQL